MPQRYAPVPCPVNDAMDRGRAQFASAWRAWVAQWTQTEWLKLAEALHGAKILHSSQYAAFSTGALIEPGPKSFVAAGYFNVALARCAGWADHRIEEVADIGVPGRLPETMMPLWYGRDPLCSAEGNALGPSGLFLAFCGLLELYGAVERSIPASQATEASAALGAALRRHLALKGVDFIGELPAYAARASALEDLLLGNPVEAPVLEAQIAAIADAVGLTEDDIWRPMLAVLG